MHYELRVLVKRLFVTVVLSYAITVGILQSALFIALACCGHQDESIGVDFGFFFYPLSATGIAIALALMLILAFAYYLSLRIIRE